ncbi:IS66 family insertion sequence element accessory protein TnpB [Rhizobium ruizarguesonis]|uniref:IS66 family insertion sequence element accessory protein TnpB n=3 Tax=Rhizobium TaxID=379 RepID=UPI0038574966
MIPVPSGVKVWLATGHTDMRKGFPGLSLMVQETLKRDPMCGHLFVFRGRGGGLIKVIWHDGQGACLFTKKLERGRFIWPSADDGTVVITRLSARRHRLADAAKDLAANIGRMSKSTGMADSNMIPSCHERRD